MNVKLGMLLSFRRGGGGQLFKVLFKLSLIKLCLRTHGVVTFSGLQNIPYSDRKRGDPKRNEKSIHLFVMYQLYY